MGYLAIALSLVFSLSIQPVTSAYAVAVCHTDSECQAADGEEI